MSLRILVQPGPVKAWLAERNGIPARRYGSDTDMRIAFGETSADYQPITVDELLEAMKFHHLAMLVDQEPGKTFHKFYRHR